MKTLTLIVRLASFRLVVGQGGGHHPSVGGPGIAAHAVAEVGGDDARVLADGLGRAFGDHLAELKHDHAVADAQAPVIVGRLLPVVREFATSNETGVLLVEQHVHLALKIADRGYILSHGELAATGSAEQLRRDDALLAASYLGGAAGGAPG